MNYLYLHLIGLNYYVMDIFAFFYAFVQLVSEESWVSFDQEARSIHNKVTHACYLFIWLRKF